MGYENNSKNANNLYPEHHEPTNENNKMYELNQVAHLSREIRALRFENERLIICRTHAHELEIKN